MSRLTEPTLQQRIADALLTTDATQRMRLAQAGLASLLMAFSIGILAYASRIAGTSTLLVTIWSSISMGGLVASYLAIRCGWSRRLSDPSLTLPQMLFAITSGAVGYAMAGPLRGAAFPVLLVILMFGMFQLRPGTVVRVCLFATALFGAAMWLMSLRDPLVYPPAVELGHFLMLAATLPTVALLSERLTHLRERSSRQRHELAQALARIQDLATRDELTGLINRRHMLELLEQERQRCARSGHTFCVALLDIDHFKSINDRFGHAAGDAVLRQFAREAMTVVRLSDVLARWGGEEFVLLLADTPLQLARGGVERVRLRIEALAMLPEDAALRVTLSAGLTEHVAGEPVSEAIARADRGLYDAKANGRNRTVTVGAGGRVQGGGA
jgi:diguanylate cyclase